MGFTFWQALLHPRQAFNTTFNADAKCQDLDGTQYYTWRAFRRQNIDMMFKQLLYLILYVFVIKAIGPEYLLMRANHLPPEESYGIGYQLSKVASWLLMLFTGFLVMALWYPLLNWLPFPKGLENRVTKTVTNSDGSTYTVAVVESHIVMKVVHWTNFCLYMALAGSSIVLFTRAVFETIYFIDARPTQGSTASRCSQSTTKRKILVRLGLLIGIVAGVGFGATTMLGWKELGLAHVTTLEYCMIIVPAQILLGLVLASLVQHLFDSEDNLPAEIEIIVGSEKRGGLSHYLKPPQIDVKIDLTA